MKHIGIVALLLLMYMLALTRQHSDQENTYTEIVNAPFKYTGSLQTERDRFTEHTFQANLSQKLPWKLLFYAVTYGKVGHSPSGIYYMQHSYYGYYFSLQRSFLKDDRLTVRLGANAPFNKYWTSEAETVNGDYRDYQKSWNRARSFSLSVTWRFGSLKANVKKTEHSIENDDVVGGITKK